MKIIHLMSTNDYSGAENVALNIVKKLSPYMDIYYATREGRILEFTKKNNIEKVIILDKLSIKEIKRIEKEYNPDIIHAHDYKASVLAALACRKSKVIAHLHNNSPWIKKFYHPYTWILLFISLKLSKILTVSNSIEKEYVFSKFIRKKILTISNPISVQEVLRNVEDKDHQKHFDLCFTGRLTEQKNPLLFIKLVYLLKKEKPDIKAIMIGDGELRNKCEEFIEEKNLTRNVKIYGFMKNPYILMNQSKIFCLPSKWEGFGLAAFEALTLGMPAVVSDVGGLPNIVDNNCGKLCNTEKEFFCEIKKLLLDEKEYIMKSNNAIEKSKKIDNINEYICNIKKIYEELIKN